MLICKPYFLQSESSYHSLKNLFALLWSFVCCNTGCLLIYCLATCLSITETESSTKFTVKSETSYIIINGRRIAKGPFVLWWYQQNPSDRNQCPKTNRGFEGHMQGLWHKLVPISHIHQLKKECHNILFYVDEARGVCKDHSRWRGGKGVGLCMYVFY